MRFWIISAVAIVLLGSAPLSGALAPGAGSAFKIVNDPTSLDWEYYGGGYKLKPIRDPSFPGGGAAVEVDVQKGHDPYSAGANIHLNEPIVTGRNYVVRFWARTLSAKSDDGKGRILVRFFRNGDPYPGFGDILVEVGREWHSYEVTGRATIDAPASQAAVGMQLASVGQTLQIGQAIVAEGATTLEGHALTMAAPDPLPPQLAGKGELLNDPTNRNWVPYGALQTSTPTTTDVYTRRAVLLSVSAAGQNSWDAGVNAPIRGAIAKGDNLIVAVLARSRSTATEDGQGWIRLRLQSNQPPYDGFGAQDIKLTSNWRLIQWRVESEMDLPANIGEVAIHAGMAKQEVEIGPVYVVRLKSP
jgi:hypothetical protein